MSTCVLTACSNSATTACSRWDTSPSHGAGRYVSLTSTSGNHHGSRQVAATSSCRIASPIVVKTTMKAVVQDRYGSPDEVLQLREIEKPSVRDDEVLVRVHAASVHPDVWHVVTGLPYALRLMGNGIRKPKYRVPGTDLAGVVESVGKSVARLDAGDEVFGDNATSRA